MIGAFWKRAWPKLPVMIPDISLLVGGQGDLGECLWRVFLTPTPIYSITAAGNCHAPSIFFEAFCRQDGEPGRACDRLAAPKVIIARLPVVRLNNQGGFDDGAFITRSHSTASRLE